MQRVQVGDRSFGGMIPGIDIPLHDILGIPAEAVGHDIHRLPSGVDDLEAVGDHGVGKVIIRFPRNDQHVARDLVRALLREAFPDDGLAAHFQHQIGDSAHKIGIEFAYAGQPVLFHIFPAVGAVVPVVDLGLVPADMDIARIREHLHDFREEQLQVFHQPGLARADDIVLMRRLEGGRVGVLAGLANGRVGKEFGIGVHHGLGVAGRFDLRDEFHAALSGIGVQLGDLLLCIMPAGRGKAGEDFAGQSPRLGIDKMQVQKLHLIQPAQVHIGTQACKRMPLARKIDHQRAIGAVRPVFDLHDWRAHGAVLHLQKLQERGHRAGGAVGIGRPRAHTLFAHIDPIRSGRERAVFQKHEPAGRRFKGNAISPCGIIGKRAGAGRKGRAGFHFGQNRHIYKIAVRVRPADNLRRRDEVQFRHRHIRSLLSFGVCPYDITKESAPARNALFFFSGFWAFFFLTVHGAGDGAAEANLWFARPASAGRSPGGSQIRSAALRPLWGRSGGGSALSGRARGMAPRGRGCRGMCPLQGLTPRYSSMGSGWSTPSI